MTVTTAPSQDIQQDFGADPLDTRDTGNYTQEYVWGFVDKWDELIDWDRRAKGEGSFFIDVLKERGAKRVLDVATGTGFHSVQLLEAGFEVVSADGSPHMLYKAFENAKRRGHVLRTVQADWRFLNRDVHGEYDAIICLGNSFTHMFQERDRRKALAEFYAMLKHDGVLILDQRNYDSILDNGFSSKHTYYYCGEDISAEPEHVDEGLARFKYTFPDKSEYFLNMFPLRRSYTRRLMSEVGFQRTETYGDFRSTNRGASPDFYVHVAEKTYADEEQEDAGEVRSTATGSARAYYNSVDADNFYSIIWGGEDIHIGMYEAPDEEIATASHRTVEQLAAQLDLPRHGARILDLGSGYGGAARYLASEFGADVTALNLSEVENERHRSLNEAAGLTDRIEVLEGSFESVPAPDARFDVVWSQDAILHSGDRSQVLREVHRLLKPGGQFIFTDPMQTDDCPVDVLQPILNRINLQSLGSPSFYREQANELGWREVAFVDYTEHLVTHYRRVLEETSAGQKALAGKVSAEYVKRMKEGLAHWIEGGKAGHLVWGVMHFRKD